jgi:hypothetical protein
VGKWRSQVGEGRPWAKIKAIRTKSGVRAAIAAAKRMAK